MKRSRQQAGFSQGGRSVRKKRRTVQQVSPWSSSESKYFDSEVNDFAVPANTAWGATNDIVKGTMAIPVRGTDINEREGRKIAIYKIAVKGLISFAKETDEVDSLIPPLTRIILWLDTQTNATVTTSGSLMQAPTTAQSDCCFLTYQNLASLGRFRVLKDIVLEPTTVNLMTDGTATSSQSLNTQYFKIVHKFKKPLVVNFNATNGGTIADVVDNSIYLSGERQFSDFSPTCTVQCRAYYKDF